MRVGPDGRDQDELASASLRYGGCIGQLGIKIDLAKCFARARLPHRRADGAKDIGARKFRQQRKTFEVRYNLAQFRVLEIEGSSDQGYHLMVVCRLQQQRQAMATDQTGSPRKNCDTGQSPS